MDCTYAEPRDRFCKEPRLLEPRLHSSDPEPPYHCDDPRYDQTAISDGPAAVDCPCCEQPDCDSKREIENHYECEECGYQWPMTWCCACDDECKRCGTDMSPWKSIDLGPEDYEPNSPEEWERS